MVTYEPFGWKRFLQESNVSCLKEYLLRNEALEHFPKRWRRSDLATKIPAAWLRLAGLGDQVRLNRTPLQEYTGWREHDRLKWLIFTVHALANDELNSLIITDAMKRFPGELPIPSNLHGYNLGLFLATKHGELCGKIAASNVKYAPRDYFPPSVGGGGPFHYAGPIAYPEHWRRRFAVEIYLSLKELSPSWELQAALGSIVQDVIIWEHAPVGDPGFAKALTIAADILEDKPSRLRKSNQERLKLIYAELLKLKPLVVDLRAGKNEVVFRGLRCAMEKDSVIALAVLVEALKNGVDDGIATYEELRKAILPQKSKLISHPVKDLKDEIYLAVSKAKTALRSTAKDTGAVDELDDPDWPINNVRKKGYILLVPLDNIELHKDD